MKVGFVYVGPIGDHGWSYQHDLGRLAVEEHFGDKVDTTYVENVSEGADLAVDHPFLENLAARSGGNYQREADTEQLIQRLKAMLMTSADPHDSPLVREPALFGVLPVYVLLVMGILLWEWVLRRRMNIV